MFAREKQLFSKSGIGGALMWDLSRQPSKLKDIVRRNIFMSPKRELPKAQFRAPRSPNEPQLTEDIFFGEIITKFYVPQDNLCIYSCTQLWCGY